MNPSSGHATMRNMGDEVRRRSEGSSEQGEHKKLKPDHFLVYFFNACVFSMAAQPDRNLLTKLPIMKCFLDIFRSCIINEAMCIFSFQN